MELIAIGFIIIFTVLYRTACLKKLNLKMKSYSFPILTALLLLVSGSRIFAMNAKTLIKTDGSIPISLSLSTGILNGESQELMYSSILTDDRGSYKISELTWRLENVHMVGAQVSAGITDKISFNLGGWTKVGTSESYMDDYDWLDPIHYPGEWTHWSRSDTELEKGYMVDLNADIMLFRSDRNSFSAMIGFHHDTWKWEARGGQLIYSEFGGFRNYERELPDEPVITYEQKFYAPYLGFKYSRHAGRWSFNTHLVGSPFAWADAEDQHHLRDTIFEESYKEIWYLNLGAAVSCEVVEYLSISLSVDYQKYDRTDGDVTIKAPSGTYEYPDGGGISHESYMCTLSASYLF